MGMFLFSSSSPAILRSCSRVSQAMVTSQPRQLQAEHERIESFGISSSVGSLAGSDANSCRSSSRSALVRLVQAFTARHFSTSRRCGRTTKLSTFIASTWRRRRSEHRSAGGTRRRNRRKAHRPPRPCGNRVETMLMEPPIELLDQIQPYLNNLVLSASAAGLSTPSALAPKKARLSQ